MTCCCFSFFLAFEPPPPDKLSENCVEEEEEEDFPLPLSPPEVSFFALEVSFFMLLFFAQYNFYIPRTNLCFSSTSADEINSLLIFLVLA